MPEKGSTRREVTGMVTIYVVTDGMYSDYHIEGVFSTKEKAEDFIQSPYGSSHLASNADIEEWEMDNPELLDCHICVKMAPNGDVAYTTLGAGSKRGFGGFSPWWREDSGECLVWYVHTDDEQRAIKVTNEVRLQILAMDLWGDPRVAELFPGNGTVESGE